MRFCYKSSKGERTIIGNIPIIILTKNPGEMVEMGWGPQVEQNAQRARECARPLETQKKKLKLTSIKLGTLKFIKKQ